MQNQITGGFGNINTGTPYNSQNIISNTTPYNPYANVAHQSSNINQNPQHLPLNNTAVITGSQQATNNNAAAQARNNRQREQLNSFLRDCLGMGCIKGFKHFSTYSRGREELIVVVKISVPLHESNKFSLHNEAFNPACLYEFEQHNHNNDESVFLIGGYARYKRPYVWLRSHHDQLLIAQQIIPKREDIPIALRTIAAWPNHYAKVWEVISEIICQVVTPMPQNPFEVDFAQIENLPNVKRVLVTGGLINFLRNVYKRLAIISSPALNCVNDDIQRLLKLHFDSLESVV